MNGLRIEYWDETNNKMWRLNEIAETYNDWTFQTIVMEGELYGLIHRSFDVGVGQNPYEEHRVLSLRRYTGVKDKNGTEIYEGDIIQYNSPSPKHQHKHLITYDDGCFHYWKSEGMIFNQTNMNYKRGMVVVGNRYENPELLEEVKP